MSCFHPRRIFYTGRLTEKGGRETILTDHSVEMISLENAQKKYKDLRFNSSMKLIGGRAFLVEFEDIPCGSCVGCKTQRAKEWALRCMIEASQFSSNYFLTLTYDEDHLPSDNLVNKRDFQLFMKRLRKVFGDNIRFFACGEYGSKSLRPHYHAIIFNISIDDLLPWDSNLYTSKTISDIWKNGNVLIGSVTPESCFYVAKYTTKVAFGKETGEFLLMSRKPGIGNWYFKQHGDMFVDNKIYFSDGNRSEHSIPGYFKYLFANEDKLTALALKKLNSNNIDDVQRLKAWMLQINDVSKSLEYQENVINNRIRSKRSKI